MADEYETKQQVTKKFILGVALILISLGVGKLVLIPLIIYPASQTWKVAMLWVYVASWVILFIGIGLAGWEGYRLAMHKYKRVTAKAKHHVAHHTKRAASATKRVATGVGKKLKRVKK